MRIAATDYDGTLCINHVVSQSDIDAITSWRAAGNKFGLATGRDLSMAMHAIETWKIPFDFIICCNGGITYDTELNILQSQDIETELVAELLNHKAAETSMHHCLCHGGTIRLRILSDHSWFPLLGCPYTLTHEDTMQSTGPVQQISFAYTTEEEAERLSADINKEYGGILQAHYNKGCIDITRKGVSKAAGIQDLLTRNQWPSEGILVVGDGGNDLPMIVTFNGFTVHGASEEVREKAQAVFPSVGDMLLAHLDAPQER